MVDAAIDYSEIYVDTSDTIINSGTLNHGLFTISNTTNDVIGLNILECEIPYSWYVTNSSSNTLIITEAGGRVLTGVVTPGNYTANYLASVLSAIFNAATQSSTGVHTGIPVFLSGVQVGTYTTNASAATASTNYVFGFSVPSQNMYVYQNGAANNFTVNNSTSTLNVSLGWGVVDSGSITGFTGGSTPTASAQVFIGGGVVNLGGPNYLYLRSNLGASLYNSIKGTLGNAPGGGNTNVIAKIPVTVDSGSVLFYVNPNTTYYFSLNGVTINQLEFYLTLGTNSAELNFNGQSFALKLGLLKKTANVGVMSADQDNRIFKRMYMQSK